MLFRSRHQVNNNKMVGVDLRLLRLSGSRQCLRKIVPWRPKIYNWQKKPNSTHDLKVTGSNFVSSNIIDGNGVQAMPGSIPETVFLVVLETSWERARNKFHNDCLYTSCLACSQQVSSTTKNTASAPNPG